MVGVNCHSFAGTKKIPQQIHLIPPQSPIAIRKESRFFRTSKSLSNRLTTPPVLLVHINRDQSSLMKMQFAPEFQYTFTYNYTETLTYDVHSDIHDDTDIP
jgi:hypothetical protein